MHQVKGEIETQVQRIMATTFHISADTVGETSSMETIESWDSLGHMNLLVSLENCFKIKFRDDERFRLIHFKGIVNSIKAHLENES